MLILGFTVREVFLSTVAYTCETCGNHAAHQLSRRVRRFSLFFIPLFSVGTRYLDTCAACGRVREISKQQARSAVGA